MRLFVTGGAGFIGSHVIDAYLAAGHEVCVYDNLCKGQRAFVSERATLIEGDICDTQQLEKAIAAFKPQVINHHAAHVHVPTSITRPAYDAQINVVGTLNVVMQGAKHGVKRIIFASSGGAIYGEAAKRPTAETAPTLPLSPYGVSKLAAEFYLTSLSAVAGFELVILRYANVYGPRQNDEGEGGVVAIFCAQMSAQQPVTLYGDGEQTRDFVFVKDIAHANVLALEATSGCYNLGTGVATSINVLFAELERMSATKHVLKHAPAREGEIVHSTLDASLAKQRLGWQAATPLAEGLQATWRWYAGAR